MTNVRFDSDREVYVSNALSDSTPFGGYEVTYSPETDWFSCECPAFTYAPQDNKHCKHIARVGPEIDVAVAEAERTQRGMANPVRPTKVPADATDSVYFDVVLNDGSEKVLDKDTVLWLLDNLKMDDELVLVRR